MQEPPLGDTTGQHDFNATHWGLDTPSKYLDSTSPNPWPSTGFTPSLFASLGSRGFTPSGFTPTAFGGGGGSDAHFSDYFSFGGGSSGVATKRNSVSGSLDGGAGAEEGVGGFGGDGGYPGFGRKRALSSPAIFTPGGGANVVPFPFARAADQHANSGLSNFQPPKRPRFDTAESSSGSSHKRSSVDEATPESSMVLTPPDSNAPLPSIDAFAFNKGGYTDASVDPYSFDMPSQPAPPTLISMSTAPAHLPPPVSTPGIPHQTYQQFSLPLATAQLPHQPYLYELEEQRLAYAATAGIDLKPDTSALASAGSSTKKGAAGKGASKAGGKRGKKALSVDVEDEVEEKTPEEIERERKDFLERNRLAACKSRKKKKERVGQLESSASELAAEAAAQQVVALSLRREIAQLRQQINAHDGCSCEHIKGYLTRELNGGGIPTIDSLAGRVFTIDYSNVPSMGSEDDCYRDVFEPPPEAAALLATAGKKNTSKTRRTSATKAPAPAPAAAARPGIATRRSTVTATPVDSTTSPNSAFEQAVNNHAFSTTRQATSFNFGPAIPIRTRTNNDLPALPTLPSTNYQYDMPQPSTGNVPEFFVRASSAPAVTPSWEFDGGGGGGGGTGSYFPVPV